jgi:peptidoglycan/xylan/chitin deacetylase (PgdA/CDA1 family)
MLPIPILMYHAVWPPLDDAAALQRHWAADPQLRDPGARRYALDQRRFQAQIAAIRAASLKPLRAWPSPEILQASAGDQILITFDDGHISNYTLALPILQSTDTCGAFFITTNWINQPGFMNEEQLRAMQAAGMLLGTHGCSHRYFSDLTETEIEAELRDSKARLEAILQAPVRAMALPGGRNHATLRRRAADAGYEFVFTSSIGLADARANPLDLPRIPITNVQAPEFLESILRGDFRQVTAMRRSAGLRNLLKRMLGNRLYDRLRAGALKD